MAGRLFLDKFAKQFLMSCKTKTASENACVLANIYNEGQNG